MATLEEGEYSHVLFLLERLALIENLTDYKIVNVKGIPQNPYFNQSAFENLIDAFETKDGDVFVATFVKAGTTWTQQIIHLLLRGGASGGKYGDSVPWLESVSSESLREREAPNWTLELLNAAPAPRYFKTHATVAHLPRGRAKVKVIYVARNPKDSVVSLYHHSKSKPEFTYTGSFERFFEIFLAGKAENGSWFDHVLDWYKKCKEDPENYLFLKYEDMIDDPTSAILKIAKFINIPVTDELVEVVAKASSLNEMKVSASIGLNHLRQGGYGNWRTMFTVSMSEAFDEVYRYKMKDYSDELKFNFGANIKGEDCIM